MSELPILIGDRIASIPFPMTEEDFELLIATLKLWRRRLIVTDGPRAAIGIPDLVIAEELPNSWLHDSWKLREDERAEATADALPPLTAAEGQDSGEGAPANPGAFLPPWTVNQVIRDSDALIEAKISARKKGLI